TAEVPPTQGVNAVLPTASGALTIGDAGIVHRDTATPPGRRRPGASPRSSRPDPVDGAWAAVSRRDAQSRHVR
ncbi:hypothetical protein, partial [Streptomyces nondiastaticus]